VGVIIPWVNLTVTGNGGRSQRAAGRKTASPPKGVSNAALALLCCFSTRPIDATTDYLANWYLRNALRIILGSMTDAKTWIGEASPNDRLDIDKRAALA
jgi:hypothetical protein